MSLRRTDSRLMVALVAALVLLAQTFGTAHASGAMPFGPMLDAFGNPLCLTNADGSSGVDRDRKGTALSFSDCCTLGCSTMSPVLPVPGGEAILSAPEPLAAAFGIPFGSDRIVTTPGHEPGNPRAPPHPA